MTSCPVESPPSGPGRAAWAARGRFGIVAPELPPITFALAHSTVGLLPAVIVAVALGSMILLARAARGFRIAPSIGGFIGVGISAFLAHQTGTAAGSFLFDAYVALAIAAVLVVSVLVRRPLAGVAWSLIHRRPLDWLRDRSATRGYDIATLVAAGVYAARFTVGHWLYTEHATGWLIAAKLAMGPPLTLLALAIAIAAGLHADRRLGRRGGSAL